MAERYPEAGAAVRAFRDREGLTNAELAMWAGVKLTSLQHYTTGERYPCDKLAELCGIPQKGGKSIPQEKARRCPKVGQRGNVFAVTIGTVEDWKHGHVSSQKIALPCVCESINAQGIVCLAFETKGGIIHECFPVGDAALDVEWR